MLANSRRFVSSPSAPRSFPPGSATGDHPAGQRAAPTAHERATTRRLPTVYRALLLCAVAGSILFTGTYLVAGTVRPGYDAWRQPISALSHGPGGWVQAVNFVVFGLLIAGSTVGWRAALAPGLGATAIPALKGLTALALIVDGFFPQDPANGYPPGVAAPATPTLHGTIHLAGAFVAIITLAAACFVFAARFAREPRWHAWVPIAALTGIFTIVFIAAFGAMTAHGPAGLFERLATGINSLFTLALVARLLIGTGRISAD